jgi:hypothetical protein
MDEERGDLVQRVEDQRVPPRDDGRCEGTHGEEVAGEEEDRVGREEPQADQVQEVDVCSHTVRSQGQQREEGAFV